MALQQFILEIKNKPKHLYFIFLLQNDMLSNGKQPVESLLGQLDPFFAQEENFSLQGNICRKSVPLNRINLFDWLRHQTFKVKTYWSGRGHKFAMAGVGVAHEISGDFSIAFPTLFARLQKSLEHSHPGLRYYGGLRFDSSQSPDAEWKQFQSFRFIIPKFELVQNGSHFQLVSNFVVPSKKESGVFLERMQAELNSLIFETQITSEEFPECESRHDFPAWPGWEENVVHALDLFHRQNLSKIVLARKSVLNFSHPIEPVILLKTLADKSSHTFHFCFQREENSAFLGITPERLYRRDNSDIFSEAVAGTRLRGTNARSDKILGEELLKSEKELREHRWVSEMVKSSLDPFCDSITVPGKENLLKLHNVQHLQTLFKGHLGNGVSDGELLEKLHPTPAVGGFPRDESMRYIAEMEPFDRGWYAGPVGWVSKNASEFAVAIRSALVSGNSLSLFAGSGIVKGSNPKKEWQENENKILNFTKLFKTHGALC